MKVLILADQFVELNGAERLTLELAEDLAQRSDVAMQLASIYRHDLPGAVEAESIELEPRGLTCAHYLGIEVHPGLLAAIRAALRLRRVLRDGDFDVVETSVTSPSILAIWATLGLRTKPVIGIHFAMDPVRHRGIKDRFLAISARVRGRARFYSISEFASDAWAAYSRTARARTQTVYNGIADACFDSRPDRDGVRDELGIPRSARIALFVGRFVRTKGLEALFEAVGPIAKEENLYIVLAGALERASKSESMDSDPFMGELIRRSEAGGWKDRLRFAGRRRDISRLMASSDVLVHPTQTEGFGLVLVEAMAAGLQIACSNVQGIPEVVRDTGAIMTDPDDIAGFRQAVLDVLRRDEAEKDEAITRGRRRAESFRMAARVERMLALFNDAIRTS